MAWGPARLPPGAGGRAGVAVTAADRARRSEEVQYCVLYPHCGTASTVRRTVATRQPPYHSNSTVATERTSTLTFTP